MFLIWIVTSIQVAVLVYLCYTMKYCKLVADNRNLLLTVIDQVQNQFGDRFALKGQSISWFTGGNVVCALI